VFGSIGRSTVRLDNAPHSIMYGDTNGDAQTPRGVASLGYLRKLISGTGGQTPVPWVDQHVDHAMEPFDMSSTHRNHDARGHQDSKKPELGL